LPPRRAMLTLVMMNMQGKWMVVVARNTDIVANSSYTRRGELESVGGPATGLLRLNAPICGSQTPTPWRSLPILRQPRTLRA
jgi:hypothetical protein